MTQLNLFSTSTQIYRTKSIFVHFYNSGVSIFHADQSHW